MGKTTLRIMSMNLENLFSPGKKFYNSKYTDEEYKDKVNWIGDMIAKCQVHVAALTEVGEDATSCLDDIITSANNKDKTGWQKFTYKFAAEPGKGGTKIRTAVISRFKLTKTESIAKYPNKFKVDLYKYGSGGASGKWVTVPSYGFSRPVTKVRVNPPNNADPFNMFAVHLKSKRPNNTKHDDYNEAIGIARSAIQRNVEAAALRYYLDTFLPGQYKSNKNVPTLVVGDFNDTPTSVPSENIRGSFDSLPGPASTWSEVDKKRLISCARLHLKIAAYEDKLFSYVHNESFTLIDQAFVSEHLVKKFDHMEIYNDHVFRHQDLSSPTSQEKQWKSRVSDHGVVVVEFKRMLKSG